MRVRINNNNNAVTYFAGSRVTTRITEPDTPAAGPGQDPIVAWATIDSYPYDGSYNSGSETVPVAIVAIDEWVGVSSVEFTFSAAVTVGDSTSTSHTVSSSSWSDVMGTGRSGEYWVCPVSKSSIDSNGNTVTVNGITITRSDLSTFDAHAKIGDRVINTKLASETIVFVKTGDVAQENEYASVQAALNGSTSGTRGNSSCVDRIQIESGTWDITAKLVPYTVTRTAPIILEPLDPENPPTLRLQSTQNVGDWIVIEGCTVEQDYNGTSAVDIYLVGHHIGFKNCTFNRGQAGAVSGTVNATNDTKMRRVWFAGCSFDGGNRGVVTGRQRSQDANGNPLANGYSHDFIIHNCSFTGMGSCMRIEWDRSLVEYVVAYDNCKQAAWPIGQHFNFINTGNGTLDGGATTLDSVIIRGIVSSDNGTASNNYAGMQLYGKANNYAFVDFVSYVYQSSQQVFYTATNPGAGGTQISNIQICGLVIGAQDGEVDRGIAFNYISSPETTFSNILLQNTLANRILTGDVPQAVIDDNFTIRNYETAIATGAGQDDDFQTDNATIDFTDVSGNIGMSGLVTSQNPTPKAGSLLEGAGGNRNRTFDLYGNQWLTSSTIGAVEPQP